MGSTLPRTSTDSVPTALDCPSVQCRPSIPVHHGVTDDRMIARAIIRWDDSLYPEFNTRAERLRSYSNWPHRIAPSPEALSDAGFFSRGNATAIVLHTDTHLLIYLCYIVSWFSAGNLDEVICFSCGGGLKDWQLCDNPYFEHAVYFPYCIYLNYTRGKSYIRECLQQKAKRVRARTEYD